MTPPAAAIALANTPRRMLRRREAAIYCGCGLEVFDRDWRPFLPSVRKTLRDSDNREERVYDIKDLDELIEKRKEPAPVDRTHER